MVCSGPDLASCREPGITLVRAVSCPADAFDGEGGSGIDLLADVCCRQHHSDGNGLTGRDVAQAPGNGSAVGTGSFRRGADERQTLGKFVGQGYVGSGGVAAVGDGNGVFAGLAQTKAGRTFLVNFQGGRLPRLGVGVAEHRLVGAFFQHLDQDLVVAQGGVNLPQSDHRFAVLVGGGGNRRSPGYPGWRRGLRPRWTRLRWRPLWESRQ